MIKARELASQYFLTPDQVIKTAYKVLGHRRTQYTENEVSQIRGELEKKSLELKRESQDRASKSQQTVDQPFNSPEVVSGTVNGQANSLMSEGESLLREAELIAANRKAAVNLLSTHLYMTGQYTSPEAIALVEQSQLQSEKMMQQSVGNRLGKLLYATGLPEMRSIPMVLEASQELESKGQSIPLLGSGQMEVKALPQVVEKVGK